MGLRCLRFSADPVLEACAAGQHRMLLNEEGLAVARVQAALQELNFSVGPAGVDGTFGVDTGTAVSLYKSSNRLRKKRDNLTPAASAGFGSAVALAWRC